MSSKNIELTQDEKLAAIKELVGGDSDLRLRVVNAMLDNDPKPPPNYWVSCLGGEPSMSLPKTVSILENSVQFDSKNELKPDFNDEVNQSKKSKYSKEALSRRLAEYKKANANSIQAIQRQANAPINKKINIEINKEIKEEFDEEINEEIASEDNPQNNAIVEMLMTSIWKRYTKYMYLHDLNDTFVERCRRENQVEEAVRLFCNNCQLCLEKTFAKRTENESYCYFHCCCQTWRIPNGAIEAWQRAARQQGLHVERIFLNPLRFRC